MFHRTTTWLWVCLSLLWLVGCSNQWDRSYTGDTIEDYQITFFTAAGTGDARIGGDSNLDETITLTQQADDSISLTFQDCTLQLQMDDDETASVADNQQCTMHVSNYNGPMTFTGEVYFSGNQLFISLHGSVDEDNVSGGYSYQFTSDE